MTDQYGLGIVRTLKSFEERVGVNFETSTELPDARNAGWQNDDFNDSVAARLDSVLSILSKAGIGKETIVTGGSEDRTDDIAGGDRPPVSRFVENMVDKSTS